MPPYRPMIDKNDLIARLTEGHTQRDLVKIFKCSPDFFRMNIRFYDLEETAKTSYKKASKSGKHNKRPKKPVPPVEEPQLQEPEPEPEPQLPEPRFIIFRDGINRIWMRENMHWQFEPKSERGKKLYKNYLEGEENYVKKNF